VKLVRLSFYLFAALASVYMLVGSYFQSFVAYAFAFVFSAISLFVFLDYIAGIFRSVRRD
jgi:hypothetical protein